MSVVLLYIPVPDRETGLRLAGQAVSGGLAACANLLGPMDSVYAWEGAICREEERVLLLKTTPELAEAAAKRIEELHPYDCPCVIRLSSEANIAFSDWVHHAVGSKS